MAQWNKIEKPVRNGYVGEYDLVSAVYCTKARFKKIAVYIPEYLADIEGVEKFPSFLNFLRSKGYPIPKGVVGLGETDYNR